MAKVLVATLACLSLAAGNPHFGHGFKSAGAFGSGCPTGSLGLGSRGALPEYEPAVIQSVVPTPVNFGSATPGVLVHEAAPMELNYFEKPWIVKHTQSAALNVFTQTPVVVDEYAPPAFRETAAPPAVVVETVAAPGAGAGGPGFGSGFGGAVYGGADAYVGGSCASYNELAYNLDAPVAGPYVAGAKSAPCNEFLYDLYQ